MKTIMLATITLLATLAGAQTKTSRAKPAAKTVAKPVSRYALAQVKAALRIVEDAAATTLPPEDTDSEYTLYDPFTTGLLQGTQRDMEEMFSETTKLSRTRGDYAVAMTMIGLMEWLDHERELIRPTMWKYMNENERTEIDDMEKRASEHYFACHHVVYQILQTGKAVDDSPCDVDLIMKDQKRVDNISSAALERHGSQRDVYTEPPSPSGPVLEHQNAVPELLEVPKPQ